MFSFILKSACRNPAHFWDSVYAQHWQQNESHTKKFTKRISLKGEHIMLFTLGVQYVSNSQGEILYSSEQNNIIISLKLLIFIIKGVA